MVDLLTGTTKNGAALVGELVAKKRAVAVDWKEHPIEVMAHVDRLAGAAWRKDASRWDAAEELDLDHCLPDKFLPVCAAALADVKRTILTFDRDSDEAIFAIVPIDAADDLVRAVKARKTKVARVVASATREAGGAAGKNGEAPKGSASKRAAKSDDKADAAAKKAAKEQAAAKAVLGEARAELEAQVASVAVSDGAFLRDFHILHVVRLELAAGSPAADVRKLLDLAVTNELASLEAHQFRTHGPHQNLELLGAALLVGRGHELVRGLAHVLSLGSRSQSSVWSTFLGRDLPPTSKRGGEAKEVVALFGAKTDAAFVAAAKVYLTAIWSSFARGMKGSRASLFVTGLAAMRGVTLDLDETLDRYVARALLPAPASPKLTRATGLPACPALPRTDGAPRDAGRAKEDAVAAMKTLAEWARASIAHAKDEKSGGYLRGVPETAAHVAVCAYAAGAGLDDVRAWLTFAVDLEIARCDGRYAEDVLLWQDALREIAGAAVLLDRGAGLAAAWRQARTVSDADRPVFDEVLAWLEGKRPASSSSLPKRRVPKAIVAALRKRDEAAVVALVKTPTVVPVFWPDQPWSGPFSTLVTALAKALPAIPKAAKGATMGELVGEAAVAAPSLVWPKAAVRTKLPLESLRGIVATAMQRIDVGAEARLCASDCLLVARCVHALGAPVEETAAWIHRAVDWSTKGEHLDEDVFGAARMVGRAREAAKTLHTYDEAPDTAEHAFIAALRAFANGKPFEVADILKKRFFFREFVSAAAAAHAHDHAAMRAALGRAPWQHRREWMGSDARKRPPHVSWFVMGLAVEDGGLEGLPPSSRPLVDEELVQAAIDGRLARPRAQ